MDNPEEVARRLRGLASKAKEHAKDSADLAEVADHAADVVEWTQVHVVPFVVQGPSLGYADYLAGIERAENDLLGANWNVSSARSYVQVVSSGTAAFASGSIADRLVLAPQGHPVFQLSIPEGDGAARRNRLAKKVEAVLPGYGLPDRLDGAWTAFYGGSQDSLAQAAHSMREVLTALLDELAPVKAVRGAPWWKEVPDTAQGVSKRQKIKFFLVGDNDVDDLRVDAIDRLVDEAHRSHGAAVKAAHHSDAAGQVAVRNTLVAMEHVLEEMLDTRTALRR